MGRIHYEELFKFLRSHLAKGEYKWDVLWALATPKSVHTASQGDKHVGGVWLYITDAASAGGKRVRSSLSKLNVLRKCFVEQTFVRRAELVARGVCGWGVLDGSLDGSQAGAGSAVWIDAGRSKETLSVPVSIDSSTLACLNRLGRCLSW